MFFWGIARKKRGRPCSNLSAILTNCIFVDKKRLFLQECQCFQLYTVFKLLGIREAPFLKSPLFFSLKMSSKSVFLEFHGPTHGHLGGGSLGNARKNFFSMTFPFSP